jgi:hypothetical protein
MIRHPQLVSLPPTAQQKGPLVSKQRTKKKKLTVEVAGDRGALVQIGNPWADKDTRRDAAAEMNSVYMTALSHVSTYGAEISGACDTFKNFVETKIEQISADDVEGDVVKKIFSVSMDLLKDMIPGAEGVTELGKVVRDKIKDGIFEVLSVPASKVSGEVDKDKLKETMRNLAQSGKNLKQKWTTSSPGGEPGTQQTIPVLQRMATIVSTLQNNLKANAKNAVDTSAEQEEFLDIFYDADAEEVAALLSHFYAIPTPAQSRSAAWAFYKSILLKFAKVYGWASATKREQAMQVSGLPSGVQTRIAKFNSEGQMYWHGSP